MRIILNIMKFLAIVILAFVNPTIASIHATATNWGSDDEE